MPLSVDRVTLAGTSIETLFYGVNIVLYTMSTYLLAQRSKTESYRSRKNSSRWYLTRNSFLVSPMFITTTIMFMCITAHWMIDIYALFQGFIDLQGVTTSAKYFNDWARRPEVWKVAFMNVALLFGDGLMIYRTWIVWNNSIWAVIFPLLSLLGALVCYIGVIVQFTRIPSDGTRWFVANVLPWVTGDCVFTICINVYTTLMISWRILRYNYEVKKLRGNTAISSSPKYLTSALALVTESAIIYTIWTILFFATDERQADLEPFFNLTWASVSGFSAFLINMRVGLGWANTNTRLPTTSFKTVDFSSGMNGQSSTNVLSSTAERDEFHMAEVGMLGQEAEPKIRSDSQSEVNSKKDEAV